MKFHKEGYKSLIIVLVFIGLLNWSTHYWLIKYPIIIYIVYLLSAFLLLAILQFFRQPIRKITLNKEQVLSPCDGKVVVIEEVVEGEYFKDKRIQLSIFMSPINVHNNLYPISGILKYFKYHPGKYLVAWDPKSSTDNERTTVVVEDHKKRSILFRQIAGAMARRIVFYGKEGEDVQQGDECGFIKFGSRVDLFLPMETKINVKLNEKTVGGQTVIATFNNYSS